MCIRTIRKSIDQMSRSMFFQRCHRCLYQETLQTRRRGWAKPRMANDDRDLGRNNEVGREQ